MSSCRTDERVRRVTARVILLMLAGLGCASPPSPVTTAPLIDGPEADHASLVVRLGVDTIMIERFSTSRGVTVGDLVDRVPTTSVVHYTFTVDSDGHITRIEVTQRTPGATATSAPLWHATAERARGGFDVAVQEGDSARRRFVAAPADAIPLFGRSVALYQVATARLRRAGADSIAVPVFYLGELEVTERTVRTVGADSVVIPLMFPRGERARVERTGRILGVSGLATSYKWLTERVADLDVAALTRSFADRDAAGAAFRGYSSRDTARAVIDGGHIAIDYGRPSKRGRVIFGGVVPWGEVWRTGADRATHLTTDRALRLDGLLVPAGTFTLYTLPSPAGWRLIVNRKTGQSGLVYDPGADLGRVDMSTTVLPRITERLTITVESASAGGVLRIAWDTLRAEARFTLAPASAEHPP